MQETNNSKKSFLKIKIEVSLNMKIDCEGRCMALSIKSQLVSVQKFRVKFDEEREWCIVTK